MKLEVALISLAVDIKNGNITQNDIINKLYELSNNVSKMKDDRWEEEKKYYEDEIMFLREKMFTEDTEEHYKYVIRNLNKELIEIKEKYKILLDKFENKDILCIDKYGNQAIPRPNDKETPKKFKIQINK